MYFFTLFFIVFGVIVSVIRRGCDEETEIKL